MARLQDVIAAKDDVFFFLIQGLLRLDPAVRYSAREALHCKIFQ